MPRGALIGKTTSAALLARSGSDLAACFQENDGWSLASAQIRTSLQPLREATPLSIPLSAQP